MQRVLPNLLFELPYSLSNYTPFSCDRYPYMQLHEFDELRFDVRAHDCNYFLRASSLHEKDRWVEAIEANQVSLVFLQATLKYLFSLCCRSMFLGMVLTVLYGARARCSPCQDSHRHLAHLSK